MNAPLRFPLERARPSQAPGPRPTALSAAHVDALCHDLDQLITLSDRVGDIEMLVAIVRIHAGIDESVCRAIAEAIGRYIITGKTRPLSTRLFVVSRRQDRPSTTSHEQPSTYRLSPKWSRSFWRYWKKRRETTPSRPGQEESGVRSGSFAPGRRCPRPARSTSDCGRDVALQNMADMCQIQTSRECGSSPAKARPADRANIA